MKGYKTSKDYKHLKELVESGKEVVCFVTWNFNLRSNDEWPMIVTDICLAKYFPNENKKYVRYSFSSRGHIFGDYWPDMDEIKYTFEDLCEMLSVEYIEPTEK